MLQRVLKNAASSKAASRGFAAAAQAQPASLTQPYTKPSSQSAPAYKESAEQGVLSNGVKIASVSSPSPLATIGVYVNAGSRVENDSNIGASQLLQHMAFKTTVPASAFRTARALAEAGAVSASQADRNSISYSITADPSAVPLALSILRASIREPLFEVPELEAVKTALIDENKALHHQPASVVWEALHSASFGGKNLGRGFYPTYHESTHLNTEKLLEFNKAVFSPERLVVVGVNVPKEALTQLAEATFGDLKSSGSLEDSKASFQAGSASVHKRRDDNQVDFALGFQGVSWADQDKAAAMVLESLFNGGKEDVNCALGGVTAGGVAGSGISTIGNSKTGGRLGAAGVPAVALNVKYSDTGLFAVYGRAEAGKTKDAVLALVEVINKLKQGASEEEIARAKVQAKARAISLAAQRSRFLEHIGQQAFAQNVQTLSAKLAAIDQLSTASLGKVAARLLGSKPSVSAYGDLADFPNDIIAKQF